MTPRPTPAFALLWRNMANYGEIMAT